MHELSIAMSLVDAACDKAAELGGVRVEALHVRVGALSGVVKEALLFSFDLAAEGTAIAGARLVVEDVPVTVYCTPCAARQQLASIQHFRCPMCGTPTAEVVGGRELELATLEVTDLCSSSPASSTSAKAS
jgi:hydrogenase nickel incorporation protein HypA/HybF